MDTHRARDANSTTTEGEVAFVEGEVAVQQGLE